MSLGTATIEVREFPRNACAADWLSVLTQVSEFLRDNYLAKRGEVEIRHTITGDRVEIWFEPKPLTAPSTAVELVPATPPATPPVEEPPAKVAPKTPRKHW